MPSTSANPPSAVNARRRPQQNRAELRRASFLQTAERLFGEHGYEAVTMTAIAEQAQASIGTLYDYFPDKLALALALVTQYNEQAQAHWAEALQRPPARRKVSIADTFIEAILAFIHERPAYLPLFDAPLVQTRTRTAREPLRRTIATALQALKPSLPTDRAFLNAQVIVEIIKGMLSVYRQAAPKEKDIVVTEFKTVMRLYLTDALA